MRCHLSIVAVCLFGLGIDALRVSSKAIVSSAPHHTSSSTSTTKHGTTLSTSTRCSSSAPAKHSQPVSKDGRCGAGFGGTTCLGSKWGNCCSDCHHCGSSSEYCAPPKCQVGYGLCNPMSSSKHSSTTKHSTSSSTKHSTSSSKCSSSTKHSTTSSKSSSTTKHSTSSSSAHSSSSSTTHSTSSSLSSSSTSSSSSSATSSITTTSSSPSPSSTASSTPSASQSSSASSATPSASSSTPVSTTISSSESSSSSSSSSSSASSSSLSTDSASSTSVETPSSTSSVASATPSVCTSGTQYVTNGDFETGSLSPFTVTNYGDDAVTNDAGTAAAAASGAYGLQINTNEAQDGNLVITQQLTGLPAGTPVSCSIDYHTAGQFEFDTEVSITIGGMSCVDTFSNSGSFTTLSGSVTTNGDSPALQIQLQYHSDSDASYFIDNISVTCAS